MKEEDNNKRIKSIVKLGLWVIFIIGLLVISGLGNNNDLEYTGEENIQETEDVKITYQDMLDKLDNNYNYKYEIKIKDVTYIYNGSKLENRESGYRLVNEEYLYYFLENSYTYQVNNGGLDKITSIYDSSIDLSNLDVTKIKESIASLDYTLENNSYTYVLEDKTIIIFVNEENIEKIEISIGDDYYKLQFSDIGKVKEITY